MREIINNPMEAQLLADLREGRLQPGERLPTTAALAKRFGYDLRTVQQALASLAARGFLDRKPRVGTFVRESRLNPTIGMLTGWNLHLERNEWPRLLTAHLREALDAKGYQLRVFDDLFAAMVHESASFDAAMERLGEQFSEALPVGFLEVQFHLQRFSALYPEWQRPSVSIGRPEYGGEVSFHRDDFFQTSLRHLYESGRRRVLYLGKSGLLEHFPHELESFWQTTRQFGFHRAEVRELYIRVQNQELEPQAAALMSELIGQWKTRRRNERPDALLVGDDVMMRGIGAALTASGVAIPEELAVVSFANEGITPFYPFPLIRYEYPLGAIARGAVELLDLKLRKQPGVKRPPPFPGTLILPGREVSSPPPLPQPHFTL